MKNLYVLFIALFAFTISNAQIVDIPDANFKFTLVNLPCVDTDGDGFGDSDVDTNDDGEIQLTEAETVDNLFFGNQGIISLEGIQSFINLKEFQFGNEEIISIDLSQNLQLTKLGFSDSPIISIDLSQNINLIEFGFGETEITEIDLSQNTQLEILGSGSNPLLSSLNITQNVNLESLHLIYNNLLSEIDISNNINLEEVLLYNNSLTSLDVSNNPNIVWLDIANNQISNIDLSQNISLERIDLANNQLAILDLSQNPNLFRINCENNQLTFLDIKNGNTNGIARLMAFGNPNFNCIQVDDVTYANNQICNGSNDGNWCKDDTAVYSEDCNLGIDVFLDTQIILYPNPVKSSLQINTQNDVIINKIEVYDVLGKRVLESEATTQLDISRLTSGLLFVKIETDKGFAIKKVVKE